MPDLAFRLLQPNETPLLVDFIREIYGESYPNDLFYDSNKVAHLIENKQLISSIAMDCGRIVGHLATYYESPEDITGDGITALVLPEYRGQNVMSQLSAPMWADYEQRKLAGLHLYAVTIHDASQRKSLDADAVVTGVLTHDWPGNYQATGFQPVGLDRMPMVCMFMRFKGSELPARQIYIPEQHRGVLSAIYRDIGAERRFESTVRTQEVSSMVQFIDKPRQGVTICRFKRVGEDALSVVTESLGRQQTRAVHYIDVPITEPGADLLIRTLEASGWVYGCLLPERLNTDYLRLQRVRMPDNWGNAVFDARTEPMLNHILKCA